MHLSHFKKFNIFILPSVIRSAYGTHSFADICYAGFRPQGTDTLSIVKHGEGNIVKHYLCVAMLGLLCCGAVQAAAVDLDNNRVAAMRASDASVVFPLRVVAPPSSMSELPEPEVFAMMLVGLLLIGYRATRHSTEKFK